MRERLYSRENVCIVRGREGEMSTCVENCWNGEMGGKEGTQYGRVLEWKRRDGHIKEER